MSVAAPVPETMRAIVQQENKTVAVQTKPVPKNLKDNEILLKVEVIGLSKHATTLRSRAALTFSQTPQTGSTYRASLSQARSSDATLSAVLQKQGQMFLRKSGQVLPFEADSCAVECQARTEALQNTSR